jgi:tetratricopeptide (TPR) repeat protein
MAREPRQLVGRRLWRRRRRRSGDDDAGFAHDDHADPERDEAARHDQALLRSVAPAAPQTTTATEKPGFFARLFGRKPPPPPPPYLQVDPIADILALPRGAARLDAFEKTVSGLEAGTPDHRRVALAFHSELIALATDAGVDLTLFEARVNACAAALIGAGEDEKAGTLYARIGRRHQAAELFVRAGAIDALEEAHAELAFAEGGRKHDARLAFERFETLFLVGRRDDAIEALDRAVALWDNPAYVEVQSGVKARTPPASTLTLAAGDDVVRLTARFPLLLGRGEDSAVRIDSPLVSRAHVEIERRAGSLVLRDLVSSGGTRVDDKVIDGPTALGDVGTIDLAGVVVDYVVTNTALTLRPRLRPRHVTIAARADVVDEAPVGGAIAFRGGKARLVATGKAILNGDPIRLDTLLFIGDRVELGGRRWMVQG